jgi:hypothetical protein
LKSSVPCVPVEACNLGDAISLVRVIEAPCTFPAVPPAGRERLNRVSLDLGRREPFVMTWDDREALLAQLDAMPGAARIVQQDLNNLRGRLERILRLQIRGYDLYLTGLRRNARTRQPLTRDKSSLAFLDEGDTLINRAAGLARAWHRRVAQLNRKYALR